MSSKRPAAQAVSQSGDDDDRTPRDMDKFRNELARRIARIIGNRKGYWRGCKEPACRRQRASAAPHIHCSNAPPCRPVKPEQYVRFMAKLQRLAREQIARHEAERPAGEKR